MESKQAISVLNFSMLMNKKEEEVVWLKLDLKHQITHFKSLLKLRMFHCVSSQKSSEEIQPQEESKLQTQEIHTSRCSRHGNQRKNTA